MFKFLSAAAALVAIGLGIITYYLHRAPDRPNLDYDQWWGEGVKQQVQDTSIRPFTIEFTDAMIEDLKQRLRNRRAFTRPMEGIQSEYGMNTVYLDEKLNYWAEKYDFKKRADLLNQYPHFKTKIQGLDIHFIRVKPKVVDKKVLPILLLHGYPSSSKEFVNVLPLLTTPRDGYDFVFEVIAADLPGFGFSQGTNKPGLNPVQMGIVMRNLMRRLGFDKFYLQGGDWGSQVATHLVTIFPDEVLGFHTNMPLSSRPISIVKLVIGSFFPSLFEYADRIYPLSKHLSYIIREFGYFHIQATKPDTIGAALTDTPVGMAGYMMEKIGMCSNRDQMNTPHNGLDNLNIDEVLDTVTIAWANNCIGTSTRIYAEAFAPQWTEVKIVTNIPSPVPTAALNFRYEVLYQPDWLLRDKFPNLVRSTTFDFGGHFAGIQTPNELADDIFNAVVAFLEFHKKNGN